MARSGGKTSVWLAMELAAQLDAWETARGETVNLSEVLAEGIRRRIGRMNDDDLLREHVAELRGQVAQLVKDQRALARRLKVVEKGAGRG
jgi:uncharacterized protein YhaN